jgi:hypothetical protein
MPTRLSCRRRLRSAQHPCRAAQGFGWAIAKCLAEAGAEISLGVWVPALNIFETSLRRGKFDESRRLSNGALMEFAHIYPMDAVFDTPDDVPADVSSCKAAGPGALHPPSVQAAGWAAFCRALKHRTSAHPYDSARYRELIATAVPCAPLACR